MLPFDQDICVRFVTPALLLSWRYCVHIYKNIVYIRKHLPYTTGRLYYRHYCIGIFGLDERQFSKDKDL